MCVAFQCLKIVSFVKKLSRLCQHAIANVAMIGSINKKHFFHVSHEGQCEDLIMPRSDVLQTGPSMLDCITCDRVLDCLYSFQPTPEWQVGVA